jgi:hypothetical protein
MIPQPTPQKRQTDLSHFQLAWFSSSLALASTLLGTEMPIPVATDAAMLVLMKSRRVWLMLASRVGTS